MNIIDALELGFSIFAYGMASYLGFRALLWAAFTHNEWLQARRIARGVAYGASKGYPTLLDVARMLDADKKTARQGSPQGGLDGPNG